MNLATSKAARSHANTLPGLLPDSSARNEHEVVGKLAAIVWKADDSSFVIARLADNLTVKGQVDPDDLPQPGLTYRFHGRWVESERYGEQFEFASFGRVVPHDRAGIVAYLQAVAENVGEGRARKLWDAFGADAVTVLREQPERVAATGIMSEEAAREAAATLAEEVKFEATKIDLLGLFAGRGFQAGRLIKECLRRWGAAAPELIRRNAYLLMLRKLPSAGFKRCDKLYLDLGGNPARLKRQTLCAAHFLKTTGRGDTWFLARTVGDAIKGSVPSEAADPLRALKLGIMARQFNRRRVDAATDIHGFAASALIINAGPAVYIAERSKALNEAAIATKVKELLNAAGSTN